jgi:predicted RecB family endonuclease
VQWLVSQRLERGAVTSFGSALQEVAKVFSEGTGVEGADVLKTKGGTHYHIQVKSGPNTVPRIWLCEQLSSYNPPNAEIAAP